MNKTLEYVQSIINIFLTAKQKEEKEGDIPLAKRIWPSTLPRCLRQQWYNRKLARLEISNPKMQLLARIGTGFHKVLNQAFPWVEVRRVELTEGYVLSGAPDGIIDLFNDLPVILFEGKTREVLKAYKNDWMQIGATAILFPEAEEAVLGVFSRTATKWNDVYELFHASKRRLNLLRTLARKRIDLLIQHLVEHTLPKAEIRRWCEDCPYQTECILESVENENVL